MNGGDGKCMEKFGVLVWFLSRTVIIMIRVGHDDIGFVMSVLSL